MVTNIFTDPFAIREPLACVPMVCAFCCVPRQILQTAYSNFTCRICREIGVNLQTPDGARIVDAKGMLVIPGTVYIQHDSWSGLYSLNHLI